MSPSPLRSPLRAIKQRRKKRWFCVPLEQACCVSISPDPQQHQSLSWDRQLPQVCTKFLLMIRDRLTGCGWCGHELALRGCRPTQQSRPERPPFPASFFSAFSEACSKYFVPRKASEVGIQMKGACRDRGAASSSHSQRLEISAWLLVAVLLPSDSRIPGVDVSGYNEQVHETCTLGGWDTHQRAALQYGVKPASN